MFSRKRLAAIALVWGALGLAQAATPTSPDEVRPVLVGSGVPAVTLTTSDGKPYALAEAHSQGPALIVFYRGGW